MRDIECCFRNAYLLEVGPTRFLAFAKVNRATYTDIARERRVLPYWLGMQARWELLHKQGPPYLGTLFNMLRTRPCLVGVLLTRGNSWLSSALSIPRMCAL